VIGRRRRARNAWTTLRRSRCTPATPAPMYRKVGTTGAGGDGYVL